MDWKTLLAYITGTVDQELLLRNEYLVTENRLLRSHIKGRIRLSDGERTTLAEIGQKLGKQALQEVATLVKPDTILGWHRKLAADKFDGSTRRKSPRRPRVGKELEDLVVQMAKAVGEATEIKVFSPTPARRALFDRVTRFFEQYSLLIGPTTQVVPFDVSEPYVRAIEGVEMRDYLDWMQSCARVTVTGCPALSLPAGFSSDGLPIGMQLIAPVRSERRLLGYAKTIEAATRHATRLPDLLTTKRKTRA